jgi:hypothetical protein
MTTVAITAIPKLKNMELRDIGNPLFDVQVFDLYS